MTASTKPKTVIRHVTNHGEIYVSLSDVGHYLTVSAEEVDDAGNSTSNPNTRILAGAISARIRRVRDKLLAL